MGLLDIFGGDDGSEAATKALNRNREILDQIALPEYEEYVPGLYTNESANFELVQEDPLIRSAQLQALRKMAGLAETGLSDADAAQFERARQEGTQIARAGRETAINDARSRGVGGSGLEFALREAGVQAGAQRAQNAGLETAANSARQRALYNTAYGDALSQQRGDDNRVNSQNTSVINQFNRENTANRNQTRNANVDASNDAFKYNEGTKDKRFQNQMSQATGQMNLNSQEADIRMAQAEAKRRKDQALTGLVGAGVGYGVGGAKGAGIGYGIGSAI